MDLQKLNETINASGLKKVSIADRIGMTKGQFYMKCLGHSSWRVEEAQAFCEALNLTQKQRNEIFFP